jgi:POT family proton-dependent oligopeptide transporter
MYAALTCLVTGNGFFKPNVSAMVGNLYPEGSRLKDRAYNIFYMGINCGAFLAPVAAEIVQGRFGFHPAFAVAAGGMAISVGILWRFKARIEGAGRPRAGMAKESTAAAKRPIDAIPDSRRIAALIVVFCIVIVFWMVFHQNGSTLTYWANENTNWQVSGIISNAINPFWVVTLTFPLVWFWRQLDRKGKEPSTPTKMVFGMTLTGLSFFVLYVAAKLGESTVSGSNPYDFKVSPLWLISSYAVVTLGELMLSPMGLSLVSKVAPQRLRGVMMGGWFVATAIGNKLTMIGVFWDRWLHSTFFAFLGACALFMAVVLLFLIKPLKKAMPGV